MVKSGALEIIFKSHEPFQSYLLTGQADSVIKAVKGLLGFENDLNSTTFHDHFVSKLVPVEMACLLVIQNKIQALCLVYIDIE